jgi:broad specificity phosphatase PhoE
VDRDAGVSAIVYILRHGEVEHHRSDIDLTPRGREQAHVAGLALRNASQAGDTIHVFHSPVLRATETAFALYESLALTSERDAHPRPETLYPPQPDPALHNVRFVTAPTREPQELSTLFAELRAPAYLANLSPLRAEFYRGFWSSADPMGYWLTHESGGGAESPGTVLDRVTSRLRDIFSRDGARRDVYIMVTHSGPMRALLRGVFGADPGEPDFCETIALELSNDADCAHLSYRGRSAQITVG